MKLKNEQWRCARAVVLRVPKKTRIGGRQKPVRRRTLTWVISPKRVKLSRHSFYCGCFFFFWFFSSINGRTDRIIRYTCTRENTTVKRLTRSAWNGRLSITDTLNGPQPPPPPKFRTGMFCRTIKIDLCFFFFINFNTVHIVELCRQVQCDATLFGNIFFFLLTQYTEKKITRLPRALIFSSIRGDLRNHRLEKHAVFFPPMFYIFFKKIRR